MTPKADFTDVTLLMSEGDQVYMEVDKVDYEVANMEFDKVADVVVILMEMM